MTVLILLVASCAPRALAQVPFDTVPSWISNDGVPGYGTGAAWADIDRDGWLDLVVADGNDMARQHVMNYHNDMGSLMAIAGWQSGDIDYHGHVSIADVNGDGYPDVGVSVYIGEAGFSQKGYVKLYMNNHGILELLPSWRSKDSMYTFSCAFGDADGDGRPDLAVACGESYNNKPEQNRIYYNRNGVLDTLPGWKSSTAGFSYDVVWSDFDNDGRLDLAFAGEKGANCIYKGYGDSVGTEPIWNSSDAPEYANSLFAADVNNDSYPDLAVSDNNQLGGSGHFKIYRNASGTLEGIPSWTSNFSGYGSGITLADINNDGECDLIAGGWWQPCRIYVNHGGAFNKDPEWTSATSSVVEAIVVADVDYSGLDTLVHTAIGDGARKLFSLPHAPLQDVAEVRVEDVALERTTYWYDRETGWLSLQTAPLAGDTVSVVELISSHREFAVSNWDPAIGNYLFSESGPTSASQGQMPKFVVLRQNYPNPFNPSTTIEYELPARMHVSLRVFNLLGQEVALLVNDVQEAGHRSVHFNASDFPSGVYLYELMAGDFVTTKRLVVLR
jgi:hypothetical protein